MLDIKWIKNENPKPIPGPENPLVFGTIFTDHMFVYGRKGLARPENRALCAHQPGSLRYGISLWTGDVRGLEGL